MSGESNSNQKNSDIAGLENSDDTGKKLRRNYCYVCKVQCTAPKNFLDHKKGKKHLKNLCIAKKTEKRNIIANEQKSIKAVDKSSSSLKPDKEKSKNSKVHDSQDFIPENKAKKVMNDSNRRTPKNSKYQYFNPNYEDRYSKYQNAKYAYSNNYGGKGFDYNTRPYCDFPQWNRMPSTKDHRLPDPNYDKNQYYDFSSNQRYTNSLHNEPYENDYYSANEHTTYNSSGKLERNPCLNVNDSENSMPNSNSTSFQSFNSQSSEKKPYESNSSTSENTRKSNKRGYSEKGSIYPPQNISVGISSKSNKSAPSTDISLEKNISTPEKSSSNISKLEEKKRVRSRSLSVSESPGCEKRKRNKKGNQLIDSDSTSEEQKIKEWTNSLLDTNHIGISRLIHPSNYKEKAAVNHLITKFSKSKRKENLTRKLRSNSLGSTDINEEVADDINLSLQSLNTEETDEISIISYSECNSREMSSSLEQLSNCSSAMQKSRKISEKKSKFDSNKQNSLPTSNIKSRSSVVCNSEKSDENDCTELPSAVVSSSGKKSLGGRKKSPKSVNLEDFSYSKKTSKRKTLNDNSDYKGKKTKSNSYECSKRTIFNTVTQSDNFLNDQATKENFTARIPTDFLKTTNSNLTTSDASGVKEENVENFDINPASSSTDADVQCVSDQPAGPNSDITVESLMQLFATGSVKVKEEFNDPVMDALKGISSDELMKAYCNQVICNQEVESQNKTSNDSNKCISNDGTADETSVEGHRACISPVIFSAPLVNENITLPSSSNNSFSSNILSSNKFDNISSLSSDINKRTESLSENLHLSNKMTSEPSPQLKKLIKKLHQIASQEEKVKQNLSEAKSKISDYSSLLEEWKKKKKKLQDEEEDLRKQRNDIIKSMQNAVKSADNDVNEESEISQLSEENRKKLPTSNKIQRSTDKVVKENSAVKYFDSTSVVLTEKQKKSKKPVSFESDEITILPSPVKPEPPEIVIDDIEENAAVRRGIGTNVLSSDGPTVFDIKNIIAHPTVINCLVVFEDFLYTCSNDNTAKRFCLKDASLTVTYLHSSKNVTEIVVEKVQNEALVFTSCSTKVITLFIASTGTKIKSFFPLSSVMSICKGWGKFYAGLANGSVNVYNSKYEEREVIKTESPASRIATAHQGRLHVLVILSYDGHIAIRDAETGLLIRCVKTDTKYPSWMTVYNDLAYLSSSDKMLITLDIMSGRIEKKLYLNSHATGLAVYEDYIFTIAYSGVINCFNKDKSCDKKVFYGAGKNGLTCVHVYQNWVFTGNRKGNISLFQFDPCYTAECQFGKCEISYGLREDLEYHIEKDHLAKKKNLTKCNWRGCADLYPKNWEIKEKMEHIKTHIHAALL